MLSTTTTKYDARTDAAFICMLYDMCRSYPLTGAIVGTNGQTAYHVCKRVRRATK